MGILILFSAAGTFSCNTSESGTFMSKTGVCSSVANADMLAGHGYAFIEESVGGFLMPAKSEEEFNEKLQQAQNADIPVKACNSFIPGSMKSVGPDAVHPEILEYMESQAPLANKTLKNQLSTLK